MASLLPVQAVWRCVSIPGSVRTTNGRHVKTQHVPTPDDRFGLLQILHDLSQADRTSVVSGTSVSVGVDLGGRRIIKKKQYTQRMRRPRTSQTTIKKQNKQKT